MLLFEYQNKSDIGSKLVYSPQQHILQHSKVAWQNFVPSHLPIKKITWESQNKKSPKWWMTKCPKWWMTKLFVCYTEHQMKIVHCANTKYTNTYCQLHYSLYEPTPLHILWRTKTMYMPQFNVTTLRRIFAHSQCF